MKNTRTSYFVAAYVEAALWAGAYTDENDETFSLDDEYDSDDLAPEALAEIRAECEAFATDNADDLAEIDPEQAGCDFYLTRNRHGAGFWDHGRGAIGDRLTHAAHVYGTSALYPAADGRLYISD